MMIRKHIYYSGHVHGVGFRYTTRQVAGGYNVSGFVRNLPDSRVEVIVEGEPGTVDAFLDDLSDTMGGHIRDAVINDEPYQGNFTDFTIEY